MYALSRAGQEFCISKRKKENKKEQNGEKKQMPFHEKRQKHDGTLTKTTTKGRKTIKKLHSSFCLRTSTPCPTDATAHTHRRGGGQFCLVFPTPNQAKACAGHGGKHTYLPNSRCTTNSLIVDFSWSVEVVAHPEMLQVALNFPNPSFAKWSREAL